MGSPTSANSDLARRSSIYPPGDQSSNVGSGAMDELLRNIYGENSGAEIIQDAGGGSGDGEVSSGGMSLSRQGSFSLPKNVGNKTMEDVWKEIVTGGGGGRKMRVVEEGQYCNGPVPYEEITLEDFLTKMGAVRKEDVRIPVQMAGQGEVIFGADPMFNGRFQQQQSHIDGSVVGLGNGGDRAVGRGKRRAVQEEPIDKVTQQKQRRMIKNRESAARSRERKQAYTVELESLVTQLEEENKRLLKEQEDRTKQRFKQLMKNVIPIEEQQRPRRVLRRVGSL